MIDHLTIGSHNFEAASAFYTACLNTLGARQQNKTATEAAYGIGADWTFFVYPADAGTIVTGERMHVAFAAQSIEQVRAFYDKALAQGATSHRPPGGLLSVNERYFGAMCRDLDGHLLEVVYWKPAT
ncbi:MAG: VOC family protein [Pseudomonadota bacterium]